MAMTSMNDQRATSFPFLLRIRTPESLPVALDLAAKRQQSTRSEFVRQVLFDRLRADGFDLDQTDGRAA
jgi:hypothetical protein